MDCRFKSGTFFDRMTDTDTDIEDLPPDPKPKVFLVVEHTHAHVLGEYQRTLIMEMSPAEDYTSSLLQVLVKRNAKQLSKTLFSLKSTGIVMCLHPRKMTKYKLTHYGARLHNHFVHGVVDGIKIAKYKSFGEAIDAAKDTKKTAKEGKEA